MRGRGGSHTLPALCRAQLTVPGATLHCTLHTVQHGVLVSLLMVWGGRADRKEGGVGAHYTQYPILRTVLLYIRTYIHTVQEQYTAAVLVTDI